MQFRSALTAMTLAALAGAPSHAQTPYPPEANLRFEVWDGAQWTNTVNAHPGDRIEWRAVISYTGTRTDVQGLAEALYQPIIPNADNEGPVMDQLGPWRNGGNDGQNIAGSLLSVAQGNNGAPLTTYGRVGFGLPVASATGFNTHTLFRHSGESNGAPPGDWLRISGTFGAQWPVSGNETTWTSDDSNRVLRGMAAAQYSRAISGGEQNSHWRGGTQNLVILRQALFIGDASQERSLEITCDEASLRRAEMTQESTDNRRYVSWYTQDIQTFTDAYRTSLTVTPALAFVTVPAPGTAACVGVLTCFLSRRRR